MLAGSGLDPTAYAMTGGQGPALGIRRTDPLSSAPAESPNIDASGASVSFAISVRIASQLNVNQLTPEPITPLKTLGSIVDAQA